MSGAAGDGQARASQVRGALVITDIVDSTRITTRLGDGAMARIWMRHDAAVRALLETWRGREIDRTDGFLLLFERATDALGFCRALHATLSALSAELNVSMKARAAVHVGSVILLENSAGARARGAKPLEIEGIAKPLTARVAALTPGGHTLVTGAAAELLTEAPLLHRGFWMLKGATEPLELYEIVVPGRTAATLMDSDKAWAVRPAGETWRPVREVRHNLPAERDAFIGRAEELASLTERFEGGARLVTVLGPGGMGKSRLTQRFGWTSLGAWPGGVRCCTLADARDVDGLLRAVATALDVPLKGGDPVEHLGRALEGRGRCLIILDNVEQVLACAGEVVDRWLDLAPEAVFLVTSRSPMNVGGEQLLTLAPLSAEAASNLFLRRAADARATAPLSQADQSEVRRLVALLDGLPLAIELAAARTRLLTVGQLRARLSDRFKLLRGGRAENPRHSTLRAALDWSWDLLTEPERDAMAQLSVFEGSFDLAAVEEVLDLSAWPDAPEPMDMAQILLDRSLLSTAPAEQGIARLTTMLSVREYAAEKLAASPDAARAAEDRHIAWYARFGPQLSQHRGSHWSEIEWRRALQTNMPNLEAAFRRAHQRPGAPDVPSLLRALWQGYFDTGPYRTWMSMAENALERLPMSDRDRASISLRLIQMAAYCRPIDQLIEAAEQTIALATACGDEFVLGGVLNVMAGFLGALGRVSEALKLLDRSMGLAARQADPVAVAHTHIVRGMICHQSGQDLPGAIVAYNEAIRISREQEASSTEAIARLNLGATLVDMGDPESAVAHLEEATRLSRLLRARLTECMALINLGAALASLGRHQEARTHLERAHRESNELGSRRDALTTLLNLAIVNAELGDDQAALEAATGAEAGGREAGQPRFTVAAVVLQVRIHARRDELDLAEAALARAPTGPLEPLPQIHGELLMATALIHARRGRIAEAIALREQVEALRANIPGYTYFAMERDFQAVEDAIAAIAG